MDSGIIQDDAMVSKYDTVQVADLANIGETVAGEVESTESGKNPTSGFLVFPLPLLREYGERTRTLAALWAASKGKPTTTHHRTIARLGCLPYDTFNKQLRNLKELGAVIEEKPHAVDQSRLRLSDRVIEAFKINKAEGHQGHLSHLQIPREFLQESELCLTFSEIALLEFYRFSCRIKTGKSISCRKSQVEVSELTGFSTRTVRSATNRLAKIGKIRLEKSGRSQKVIIPGYEPSQLEAKPSQVNPSAVSKEPENELERFTKFYREKYQKHLGKEPHFLKSNEESRKIGEVLKIRGNLSRAEEYVEFAFSHWKEIASTHDFYDGPKPSLLCKSWCESLLSADMEDGIEERRRRKNNGTGLADRAGGTDWSKETDGW